MKVRGDSEITIIENIAYLKIGTDIFKLDGLDSKQIVQFWKVLLNEESNNKEIEDVEKYQEFCDFLKNKGVIYDEDIWDAYFQKYSIELNDIREQMKKTKIIILGDNDLSQKALEYLSVYFDCTFEKDEKADYAIIIGRKTEEKKLLKENEYAYHNVKAYFPILVDCFRVECGPMVLPTETPCLDNGIIPNANGEYAIGNINSKILLTIVTNVPDDAYTTGTSTFSNSASIKWDGLPDPGLGTGNINVSVGYNAISKVGVADTANQKIHWTVNVDTKGQNIPDLKAYDLLVYGNSINLGVVTGIPIGITPTDLTPRYGQKYAGNFAGGAMTVNVIPIEQGGVRVADLLEITGLSTTHLNTFTFDSQVVDPNVFAGNKTSVVWNTATLFSTNAKLNTASGNANYTNRMLLKQMLKREAMSDPAARVNSDLTNNAQDGFDYQDKSAIFRLNVNADGIDVTNATNAAGQTLGEATLTDTLPDGWEFTDISAGSKYLIFDGTGQSIGTVLATDTTPDTVAGLDASFSGRTATFTFSSLNKPYVILVKARPTSDTAAQYFSANQIKTVRNNVNLKTQNWSTGVSSYQDVTITSQIMDKNTTQPNAGELRWTVDYKPYDLAQLGERLEDQLPNGIDLRMDANGKLVLAGNITANEMILNANGTYTVGNPVTLELGKNVSYDNARRVLSFIIPDNSKAYRFSYLTDITGDPGSVTNKVSLLGSNAKQEETSKLYIITVSDGSASFLRNGWISIAKTDGAGVPLADTEFTLYAMDGTTVIKKGLTGSDGIVKLKVIPDGEYILKETKAPTGYSLEGVNHSVVVKTNGSTVTSAIDGKTGVNANAITIKNFSEGTAGNLTISKTVAGSGADTTKAFDFTLTLTGATGTYTYVGHGIPSGTIASGDTISLTHGQSITIVGLPKGATYQVSEADYSGDGYTATSTGAIGSIAADTTQTASFTNTRTVGNLTISKKVSGNAGDTQKKFDFTLSLTGNGASGTYVYTGNGVPDGTIKSGDIISLSHGQSITIAGLPAGMQYIVAEADYTKEGYISSSTGAAGYIYANALQEASFTNIRNQTTGKPETPDHSKDNINGGNASKGSTNMQGATNEQGVTNVQSSSNVEEKSMPKTGDDQASTLATIRLLCFSGAVLALLVVDFILRKKYFRKRKQK